MGVSRREFLGSVGAATTALAASQLSPTCMAAASLQNETKSVLNRLVPLDRNENPYGPSARVQAVIRDALDSVNRYSSEVDLAQEIAEHHHVKPEQVLTGCGSSELLRVAACAFLGPGRNIVVPLPTFEGITEYAQSTGADVIPVPLDKRFSHDLGGMLRRVNNATKLVYICNPNNPTASITQRAELDAFIAKLPSTTNVIVDEAYHHYAGESSTYASFLDHPPNDERIIVTRTFSAVYGLAGLRVGYAIAAPKVIQLMRPHITMQSVNTIAAHCAITALKDTEAIQSFVYRNANDRQEFHNQATARMLKPISSHANFVMMNTYHPANEVIQHLRAHNVAVGRLYPPMDTYIRISLGAKEDMKFFWQAWDSLHLRAHAM